MKTLLSALAVSLFASLSTGCAVTPVDARGVPEDQEFAGAGVPEDPEVGFDTGGVLIDQIVPLDRCDAIHLVCHVEAGGVQCEPLTTRCDVEPPDLTPLDLDPRGWPEVGASGLAVGDVVADEIIPVDGCGMGHLVCYVDAGGAVKCELLGVRCDMGAGRSAPW